MLSSSEKITQPPWAQKHLGMSVNLATFGGENKEYKIKSQPIDRFCLISLLYNWTYELMVSPTLYNLGDTYLQASHKKHVTFHFLECELSFTTCVCLV